MQMLDNLGEWADPPACWDSWDTAGMAAPPSFSHNKPVPSDPHARMQVCWCKIWPARLQQSLLLQPSKVRMRCALAWPGSCSLPQARLRC